MNTTVTANETGDTAGSINEGPNKAKRATIALSGASGYIGHNLLSLLKDHYNVICLSRHGDAQSDGPHVQWRSCDLFSMVSAEKALLGADYAVYLVHQMLPSARLTQAQFEDMDAILADNFARAARRNGIRQIVYLSGMIPEDIPHEQLSRHLRSRLEVERILGSYGVPVTTIPAGLMVGPQGSSFPILVKLSRLWVTLITGTPKEMAYPLIESLAHPIVVHPGRTVPGLSDGRISFEEAVREALKAENADGPVSAGKVRPPAGRPSSRAKKSPGDVRSIQRVILPGDTDAGWAARYYLDWLGKSLRPLVSIGYDSGNIYRVRLRASRRPILELTYLPERSSRERAVYRISGGAFTRQGGTHEGRLEFLQIPGTRECVIAIHDYLPSLPWFLYKYTQAKVHLWVMAAFRRHLRRL